MSGKILRAVWQGIKAAGVGVALCSGGISATCCASIYVDLTAFHISDATPEDLERAISEETARIGGDPVALHDLGTALYRQKHPKQARRLWDQAAAKHPDLAVGDIEVVFELLEASDVPGAEEALAAVRDKRPNDPHLHLAIGQVAMARRELETARAAYDKANELAPKSAMVLLTRGRFRQETGDMAGAREDFQAATSLAPDQTAGWMYLAMQDFRSGDIPRCLTSLKRVEGDQSKLPPAEARLADFYLEARDYPGAYRWYAAAVARKPSDPLLRTRVAQVLMLLQRPDDARKILRPLCQDGKFVSALIALAQLEETAGDFKTAASLLEQVLAQDENNLVATNNLAMLLVQTQQTPERALELAERAQQLGGSQPELQSTYGCALSHAGQPEKAVEILSQAVRREPNDPWIRYCLGMSLAKLGRQAEATEHLTACILLDGKFPLRSTIEAARRAK
ncbi:MAG: tetratricopeptide repeat protein [Pirellulales bacterium]|nr:tetratricopeptide repeat protein [Pirellulales bacterium]